mgnify:CR=1 FL=1
MRKRETQFSALTTVALIVLVHSSTWYLRPLFPCYFKCCKILTMHSLLLFNHLNLLNLAFRSCQRSRELQLVIFFSLDLCCISILWVKTYPQRLGHYLEKHPSSDMNSTFPTKCIHTCAESSPSFIWAAWSRCMSASRSPSAAWMDASSCCSFSLAAFRSTNAAL